MSSLDASTTSSGGGGLKLPLLDDKANFNSWAESFKTYIASIPSTKERSIASSLLTYAVGQVGQSGAEAMRTCPQDSPAPPNPKRQTLREGVARLYTLEELATICKDEMELSTSRGDDPYSRPAFSNFPNKEREPFRYKDALASETATRATWAAAHVGDSSPCG